MVVDPELLRSRIDALLALRMSAQALSEKRSSAKQEIVSLLTEDEIRKGAEMALRHCMQIAELDDRDLNQYRIARSEILGVLGIETTEDMFS